MLYTFDKVASVIQISYPAPSPSRGSDLRSALFHSVGTNFRTLEVATAEQLRANIPENLFFPITFLGVLNPGITQQPSR